MIELISQFFSVVIGLYFSLFSIEHRAATQCSERFTVSYCFYQGDATSSQTVYFLHGFGNDVKSWGWNPVTERIEAEWREQKTPRPHVVTLSFGQIWWYSQERGEKLIQFLNDFEIEKKITTNQRTLYGDSMGGHNSFRLAADYPHYFQRLALICPAIPQSFTEAALEPQSGLWPVNWSAEKTILNLYPGPDNERNPLKRTQYLDALKTIPKAHIIVSKSDHFGFYPGGKALYQTLKKEVGINVELEEQDIPHCQAFAQRLAPFLAFQ